MSDYGQILAPDAVRFERLLPGPIERVWAYLTESEKRGKWLASGAMELRVGGRVELRFHHADLSPQAEAIPEKYKWCEGGVTLTGRVTRCEPPRLLSHTWGEPSGGEAFGGESEVTYELTPQGEDVLLVLTHRRIARAQMTSVAGGWHTHLGILVDHLHGRVPQPFWSAHARVEGEYEKRIAAS
jgi:uncharacterized protein YndB with AHSA1/START domain